MKRLPTHSLALLLPILLLSLLLPLTTTTMSCTATQVAWFESPQGQQAIMDGLRLAIQVAMLFATTAPIAAAKQLSPERAQAVANVCSEARPHLEAATVLWNAGKSGDAQVELNKALALLSQYKMELLLRGGEGKALEGLGGRK